MQRVNWRAVRISLTSPSQCPQRYSPERPQPGRTPRRCCPPCSSTIALAQVTVLLDLLQTVCAVVLAVTLYRLSRTVDATLALLAMAFRFGEGLAGFVPLLGKLELMKLATASNPMCASSAGCLAVAG